MLKIGDKVRYSNEYIAKHELIAPGQRRGRSWFNRRRGEQKVMTVLIVNRGRWDWRTKKYTGDIIILDEPSDGFMPFKGINSHWLKFVRRDT